MRRTLIPALAVACALARLPASPASAQGPGAVSGTATGPGGPLARVVVQVLGANGAIVASTRTEEDGRFRIGRLVPGSYTLQLVGSTGAVIGTTAVLVTGGVADVSLEATAAALAGAATAAVRDENGGTAATAGAAQAGPNTAAVVAAIVAAAAAGGVIIIMATKDEASPRR